jgi:hypothetical protein
MRPWSVTARLYGLLFRTDQSGIGAKAPYRFEAFDVMNFNKMVEECYLTFWILSCAGVTINVILIFLDVRHLIASPWQFIPEFKQDGNDASLCFSTL